MNWFQLNQRASWIIGLTLVIPVLLFLNGLFGLLGVREEYQAEIERMEPRLARLQGLLEYENQLRDSAGKVDMQVVNLVYPGSADRATVSATLQKDVHQILI